MTKWFYVCIWLCRYFTSKLKPTVKHEKRFWTQCDTITSYNGHVHWLRYAAKAFSIVAFGSEVDLQYPVRIQIDNLPFNFYRTQWWTYVPYNLTLNKFNFVQVCFYGLLIIRKLNKQNFYYHCWVTEWKTVEKWFDPRQEQNIYFLTKTSTQVLETTWPPIKGVRGHIHLG